AFPSLEAVGVDLPREILGQRQRDTDAAQARAHLRELERADEPVAAIDRRIEGATDDRQAVIGPTLADRGPGPVPGVRDPAIARPSGRARASSACSRSAAQSSSAASRRNSRRDSDDGELDSETSARSGSPYSRPARSDRTIR